MRKLLRIAVPALGVLLFACLLWRVAHSDQPVYMGKSLYGWLLKHADAAAAGDRASRDQAELAIRNIGSNALPTLLAWISKRDTPLRKKVLAALGERGRAMLHLHQAQDYHALTTYACGVLKSLAKPMVPDLVILLKDSDPYVRSSAAFALDQIGPTAEAAIPALVDSLADREAMNNAMQALKDIGARADQVLPVSTQWLCSTNKDVQMAAMWALGQWGTNAQAAVPKVRQFLADPDLGIRLSATNALNRIDPLWGGGAGKP